MSDAQVRAIEDYEREISEIDERIKTMRPWNDPEFRRLRHKQNWLLRTVRWMRARYQAQEHGYRLEYV